MEIFLSKPTPREQRECSFGTVALHTSRRKAHLLRTRRQLRPARGPAIVGQPKVDGTVFERQHQKRILERFPCPVSDCRSVGQDASDAHEQPCPAWVKTQERDRPSEIPGIDSRRQQKHSSRENQTRPQRRRPSFRLVANRS